MKKVVIVLLLFITVILFPSVNAQDDITILKNRGLTQYSNTNYTFNCELATTNVLTIIVHQTEGNTYLTLAHIIGHTWVDAGFEQLDKVGDTYNFQFKDDGLYRIRAVREAQNITYKDYFVKVIGGNGTYAAGDIELYIEKGQWVDKMMLVFGKDWNSFPDWSFRAYRFFANPVYVITDFLMEVPIFLLMPQVWFIIAIVVALVILKYWRRIRVTQRDRQLSKTHGTREDLIREKRRAQEESRLHALNTMPIDYALEKYGAGDYVSRAVCYHIGSPELGVTYPSAYSLAFELGGNLYSKDEKRSARAREIISALVDIHEPILEKSYIYGDIAACAKAVSAESVEAKARTVIRDPFMKIAELAEDDAKKETEELSKKLNIKAKAEKPLSETMADIEKRLKKKKEDKHGKKPNID